MRSITIKSLKMNQLQYDDLCSSLDNYGFDAERGDGIQIQEFGDKYIRCSYFAEKKYYQEQYNVQTHEIDKIMLSKIELVPFIIDLQYSTLDIWGSKQKAALVVDFIGRLSRFQISIGNVELIPLSILLAFKNAGYLYTINRVRIKEFDFFEGIKGECLLNLRGYANSESILKEYKDHIVNFTSSVLMDSEEYPLTFYGTGTIGVHKDADSISIEFIRILKNSI